MTALSNNPSAVGYNPKYVPQSPYAPQGPKSSKKEPKSSKGFFKGKEVILVIVIIALLAVAGFLGYKLVNNNAASSVDAEREAVTASVKNLVMIDPDETLSIVKIEDPDSFKRQNPSFYKNVLAGEYLVVMSTSQRVLIYDKSQNKIVNFSSYTITPELIDESTIDASEKPLKIELRYVKSLTKEVVDRFAADLTKLSKNYEIVGKVVAKSDSYSGITLVSINKAKKPKMLQNLQNQINSSPGRKSIVDTLPANEDPSAADAVIFIGN